MSSSRIFSLLSAAIVAVGVIISAVLVSSAVTSNREGDNTIRVNGTARRIVHSDYIIWDAVLSYQAPTVNDAYAKLQKGSAILHSYMEKKGVANNDIFPLAIETQSLFQKSQPGDNGDDKTLFRQIEGYRLSQKIEIRSNDVRTVENVSRSSTELIKQGVELESSSPQYRITNLSELKDSLLAEAAANAHSRAEKIAKSSGSSLGSLQYSHMGAMTVSGAYDEDHNNGEENTEAIDKRVTVLVTSAYLVK
jgi:hypothetical protein